MRQASHGRVKIWLVVQAVLLNACLILVRLGYARKGSESNILFRSPAALQGRVPGDPSRAYVVSPTRCMSYDDNNWLPGTYIQVLRKILQQTNSALFIPRTRDSVEKTSYSLRFYSYK